MNVHTISLGSIELYIFSLGWFRTTRFDELNFKYEFYLCMDGINCICSAALCELIKPSTVMLCVYMLETYLVMSNKSIKCFASCNYYVDQGGKLYCSLFLKVSFSRL